MTKTKVLYTDISLENTIRDATNVAKSRLSRLVKPFKECTGIEWSKEGWPLFDSKEEFLEHQYRNQIKGDTIELNGIKYKKNKMLDNLPLENERKIEEYLSLSDEAKKALESRHCQYDLIEFKNGKFILNQKLLKERCSIVANNEEQIRRWDLIHQIKDNILELQSLGVNVLHMERVSLNGRHGPFFAQPNMFKSKDVCELRDIKRIAEVCINKETDRNKENWINSKK